MAPHNRGDCGHALGRRRGRGYQRAMRRQPIRILGIDPGLRRTGWGLIESRRQPADPYRLRVGRDQRARDLASACWRSMTG